MTSSRSLKPVAPFSSITPITVNVTRLILIVAPMGEASRSPKSSSTTVRPSTATRAREAMSASVKNPPSSAKKLRTSWNAGVTPETPVFTFSAPRTT